MLSELERQNGDAPALKTDLVWVTGWVPRSPHLAAAYQRAFWDAFQLPCLAIVLVDLRRAVAFYHQHVVRIRICTGFAHAR